MGKKHNRNQVPYSELSPAGKTYRDNPESRAKHIADNSPGGKHDRPNGKNSYGAEHIRVRTAMKKKGIKLKGQDVVKTTKKSGLKIAGSKSKWTTRDSQKNRGADRYA